MLTFSIKKRKKDTLFANARIGRELLRDIRSAICIEFFVKISPTLLKLDALIALIFAGQKRQLEITPYKDKAFTSCTI